jgi:hypothetical protein
LGLSFAFITPWLLLALPLGAGMLLYAYLRRGRATKKIVGSFLLLHGFQRTPRARRTFVPPLRFFLELLALLALSLAAAGLYQREEVRRSAILLDTSRSMATLAGSPETRFALGLRELQEQLSAADQSMLFVTSPKLQQRSEWLRKDQLIAVLQQAWPLEGEDSLEMAINRLLADERFARVLVLTDQQVRKKQPSERLVIVSQARSAENIALEDATVLNSGPAQAPGVRIKLAAFLSTASASVGVNLTPVVIQDRKITLLSEATVSRQLSLTGRERKQLMMELPKVPQGQRIEGLQVSIVPTYSPPLADSIAADNELYLELSGAVAQLLLVSDLSAEQLGLGALPHLSFKHLAPAAYASVDQAAYSAAIFHRYVPPELPSIASLFVYPSSLSTLPGAFALAHNEPYAAASVSKWHDTHRLLNYVLPAKIGFKQLLALSTPAWAETLIDSDRGPLLWAGERLDRRYAATGFELFPYSGRAGSTLSVLFLNALSWLSDAALQTRARDYTQGWTPGAAKEQLFDAQGQVVNAPEETEVETYYPLPGFYLQERVVEGSVTNSSVTNGRAASGMQLQAISFSSLAESNTLDVPSIEISSFGSTALQTASTESLVKQLSLGVLLLLLLDTLLFLLRMLRPKRTEARSGSSSGTRETHATGF